MLDTPSAALIAATLATSGWLYTARRARTLSRKQHTINVMLQASFNKDFHDACVKLIPLIKGGKFDSFANDKDRDLFRLVANHFEFIAAGLRNGDFDENLVRDCMRAQVIELFAKSSDYIWKLRDSQRRQTTYEHLEWLYLRWEKNPPGKVQRLVEFFRNSPLQGRRTKTIL